MEEHELVKFGRTALLVAVSERQRVRERVEGERERGRERVSEGRGKGKGWGGEEGGRVVGREEKEGKIASVGVRACVFVCVCV